MKEKFAAFLATKGISQEQFETKSAEEMAGLYTEFNGEQRVEIENLIANKASKEDVTKAVDGLRESQLKQMEMLNDAMKEMGLSIKALSEGEKSNLPKMTDLEKGLKDNLENLKMLKNGKNGEFNFTIKAAGNITSSNISGGNVPVEQRIAGLNTVASRQVRLLDIVSRGVANSNIISWVYQANKDGAAGGTTEGAAKNQIDFDLVVASQAVVKRTALIKISTEMLDDVDFIRTEIENELMRELLKDIESTAYSGNGSAPALNGVRTTATAFAAGSFALAIDNANEVDVLAVAINQILIAEQPMPNYILMHPTDVTKLKVAKVSATDKRYIERLQMIGGSLLMDGIPIIPTTLVTVDTYLVGYFDFATLYEKEGVNIQIGLDADDFSKNLRTILAEWRGAMVVKNNDRTAFVKGTFSTDKAALETT